MPAIRSWHCNGERGLMYIPCVYALKTRDALWVSRFYPVRRLREEFARLGADFEAILPGDAGPLFGRLAASAREGLCPVCMLRGDLPSDVLGAASNTGAAFLNSPLSIKKARDKLAAVQVFAQEGIPAPLTVAAPSPEGSLGDFARFLGELCARAGIAFPAVVKPRFGSRGRGVRLAKGPEEAAAIIMGASPKEERVIQEFAPFSPGRDIRIFVIGGKPVAVAERRNGLASCGGEIRSNAAAGGAFYPLSEGGEQMRGYLERTACRASCALGLFYSAVDFIFRSKNGPLVCEANGSPGFEALERGTGINVAGALARAIVNYSLGAASVP